MIMEWTQKKPTKPGLYWYWETGIINPYIVEIDNQFRVVSMYGAPYLDSSDGYWLGPLETPKKPIPSVPSESSEQ